MGRQFHWSSPRGSQGGPPPVQPVKLADVECLLVETSDQDSSRRSLLVRIVTDCGIEGWGEAATQRRGGQLRCEELSAALSAALLGRSLFDVEGLLALDVLRPRMVRLAVEMAHWDAIGAACGQPLCHLWGGVYREHVPLALRLPAVSPEAMAQTAAEMFDQQRRTLVVPASGDVARDAAAVWAVCEIVGQHGAVRLDGQSQLALDEARELCRRLEGCGLDFFLDPLQQGEEVASLASQTPLPLAVGRDLRDCRDVYHAARRRSAAAVVLHLDTLGSLAEARRAAAVAEAADVPAVFEVSGTAGIAIAALVQLAACTPHASRAHHGGSRTRDDVLAESLPPAGGLVAAGQGPGLGIEVDRARLEARQVA